MRRCSRQSLCFHGRTGGSAWASSSDVAVAPCMPGLTLRADGSQGFSSACLNGRTSIPAWRRASPRAQTPKISSPLGQHGSMERPQSSRLSSLPDDASGSKASRDHVDSAKHPVFRCCVRPVCRQIHDSSGWETTRSCLQKRGSTASCAERPRPKLNPSLPLSCGSSFLARAETS